MRARVLFASCVCTVRVSLCVIHLGFKLDDLLAILWKRSAKNLGSVNSCVFGAVDGNAGNGHAGWHLDHGKQGVHAAEVRGLHWNADDRQWGECSNNSTQVSSLSCGRDDYLEAAVSSGLGPLMDLVWSAVCGCNDQLIWNAKALELGGTSLHSCKVAL